MEKLFLVSSGNADAFFSLTVLKDASRWRACFMVWLSCQQKGGKSKQKLDKVLIPNPLKCSNTKTGPCYEKMPGLRQEDYLQRRLGPADNVFTTLFLLFWQTDFITWLQMLLLKLFYNNACFILCAQKYQNLKVWIYTLRNYWTDTFLTFYPSSQ